MSTEKATKTTPQSKWAKFLVAKVNGPGMQLACNSTFTQKSPQYCAENLLMDNSVLPCSKVAAIISRCGQKEIDHIHAIYSKKKQLDRMKGDPEFIPCLTSIDFIYHVSDCCKEEAKFQALLEETENLISKWRKVLRDYVIRAIELEISSRIEEMRTDFCKALRVTAQSFLIVKDEDTGETHETIFRVFEIKPYQELLLQHLFLTMTLNSSISIGRLTISSIHSTSVQQMHQENRN